jgi:hypothetical protein
MKLLSVPSIITNFSVHNSAPYDGNDDGSRAEIPVPGNKVTND